MKKLVGIEVVNYTSKSGTPVTGCRIHIEETLLSPNVGVKTYSEYVSNAQVSDFHLGEISALLYEPSFSGKYKCTGVLMKDDKDTSKEGR